MSSLAAVKRITDLFLLLGDDEALLSEYQQDADGVLAACALERVAVEAISAEDLSRVRALIAEENRPRRWRYEPAPR
jgi:hypothetical protein